MDETKPKNIIHLIKNLLLNLDLTIEFCKCEVAAYAAKMDLYKNSKSKYKQRMFIDSKINKERVEIFLEDTLREKEELLLGVNQIIDKYFKPFQKVFVLYFIEDMSVEDIARELNYSVEFIQKVIKQQNEDLITFYQTEET